MKKMKALFLVALILTLVGCQTATKPEDPPTAEAPVVEEPAVDVGYTKGSQAPDFTLTGLDGKSYSLSDYRGKPVQLVFWAVSCVYCMMELPELQEHYQADAGYEILALNATFQDGVDTVRESVDELGLSFPVLLLETNEDINVARDYNVSGIPHNVFINKDGIIEKVQIGATPGKEAIGILNELAK